MFHVKCVFIWHTQYIITPVIFIICLGHIYMLEAKVLCQFDLRGFYPEYAVITYKAFCDKIK